jgi:site-specific recombinase XerD
MYLYKDRKSKYWHAEIWIEGTKHRRSTRCTAHRAAQEAARRIEEELRAKRKAEAIAGASLQLRDIATRYMLDIGDYHAGADNTERLVRLILSHPKFSPTRPITEITHDDALALRRWRRQHETGPKGARRLISAMTVNDTIEQLKKLFTYVKASGVRLPNEPQWKSLWLEERAATPRELSPKEGERLTLAIAATRPDYRALFEFARASGKRKRECFTLEWANVTWDAGVIEKPGKGGKMVRVPITATIREILWPLRYQHPQFVFTFVAERTIDKVIRGKPYKFVKGERYPMTKDGVRRVWNDVRERAGLAGSAGFRFHDLRHDLATKVLRESGNLKLTAELLDHANVATVSKTYAHVTQSDKAEALERLAQSRSLNPRTFPRSGKLKAI